MFYIAAFMPWLSPGDEDVTTKKALTSMSLLLLTMLFLALHLRCRPYDFREYHILHRVESQMLWAFLITCLIQTFVYMSSQAWVFSEASENHESNKAVRDSVCSAVVIVVHLRFFLHVLFGFFGASIRRLPLLGWIQNWVGFGVELTFLQNSIGENTGVNVGHLDDNSRLYLAETFGVLAGKQLRHEYFGYSEFNDLLRRAAVEAFYHKDRKRFEDSIPWLDRAIHKKVMTLPDNLRQRKAIQGIEARIKSLESTDSLGGSAPWRMNPFYSFECDSNTPYDKAHLRQAMDETYSIDDLQMAVLQILWSERQQVDRSSMTGVISGVVTDIVASVGNVFNRDTTKESGSANKESTSMESAANAYAIDDPDALPNASCTSDEVETALPNALVRTLAASYEEKIAQMERERESLRLALLAKDAELLELEGVGTQAVDDDSEEEEEC